jgi:hypothetical protein
MTDEPITIIARQQDRILSELAALRTDQALMLAELAAIRTDQAVTHGLREATANLAALVGQLGKGERE